MIRYLNQVCVFKQRAAPFRYIPRLICPETILAYRFTVYILGEINRKFYNSLFLNPPILIQKSAADKEMQSGTRRLSFRLLMNLMPRYRNKISYLPIKI